MKLRRLEVQDFRGIQTATIAFGPGLTVLHGPNELGKSTLVEAIQAALFLQTTAQAGNDHVTWGRSTPACVTLTFEHGSKTWRVSKRFGYRRQATLECSDGVDSPRFREVVAGNGVEGRLRELLAWGIAPPGGRGAAPKAGSFLLTALLGRQGEVQEILGASLDEDRDATGKSLVTRAIGALDKDPVVTHVIESLTKRVDTIFTSQGRFKTAADSPLVRLQEHLRTQEERLRSLQEDDRKGKLIQENVVRLQDERQRLLGELESAEANWEAAKAQAERARVRAKLQDEIGDLQRQLGDADRLTTELTSLDRQLGAGRSSLATLKDAESIAAAALDSTRQQLQAAAEAVARETEAAAQSGRVRVAARAQRRAELNTRRTTTEARLNDVTVAEQAAVEAADLRRQLADASAASVSASEAVRQAKHALEHASVRAELDVLNEREQAVARATAQLADAQQREQAARDRLQAAAADVIAAEGSRDRRDAESNSGEITKAESELHLLRAVDAHIHITSLRVEVESLEETAAHARTYRDDAHGRRSEASNIDRRVASHVLPPREQVAAWRTLEQELRASFVTAPTAPTSSLMLVATGLAAGLLAAAGAHFGLGWSPPTVAVAGVVVTVVMSMLVWIVLQNRDRARAAEYEQHARRRDRWAQEVEPSLRAAGLAHVADFEGAAAKVEGLKADAQRLRREADEHDVAAVEAERAAAALETRRETLTRLKREAPVADAAAVSERMEALGGEVDAVRQRAVEVQQGLDATRARLRDAADANVRAVVEQRDARQTEYDARAREVAVAETTLDFARQQSDAEAVARLRARLADIGEASTPTASVTEASAALDEAKTQQAIAAVKADGLLARLDEVRRDFERRVSALGGSLGDAREQVERTLGEITVELTGLNTAFDHDSASAAALEHARNEHDRLAQEFAEAEATLEAATSQRKDAERAVANLETGVAARRGHLTATDRTALESRLEKATGDPVFQVPDDARLEPASARGILDGVRQQLERCTSDLNHARGQLHLIAGHVGSERLEQQEEVVRYTCAEVLESERTEQAAMRLLREIQKVEAERTMHLGRALAGPITETFRTLTGGRYGPIAFAPDLKTQHIEVEGEPRRLEFLSVGTREQLATLLRLAIAGYLQTAVVLDDQLVHSDSRRLAWFSERLRASAREHDHQVIVLTCRPGDYLGGGEDDAVTVVDLASRVSR